ncbi:MAG: gliding motility lipoprotein GldH [Candidatus Azobacteroides sp.]|nr:gliding motility lipoprotein GldH [Candidatus Azobacteroides sp.]
MNSKIQWVCPALLLLLTGLFSCNRRDSVYFQYNHIPAEGWNKNNELKFRPDIRDSGKGYDMSIELRHNNDYPYQNIYFFVSLIHNDREVLKTDTLQYLLADEFGRWKGNGCNALYQQSLVYKSKFSFPDTGKYQIVIRQAMRDDVLRGVEDVGLRIETAK